MSGLRFAAIAAFAAAFALPATSATAQRSQNWIWCVNKEHASADLQIGGCTALIHSGEETKWNLAIIFRNRGLAYKHKADYDHAIHDYNQAIRLNPDYAEAYLSRGLAFRQKDDFERAIRNYTHAIAIYPEFADAYDARCYARAILGQLEMALADCSESLRLQPDASYTLDSRGFIYLKMGQFEAAIRDYDAALKADPTIAESLFGRGIAKVKNGDAGGNADIAAAKTLNPNIAELMAKLGVREE
jgi:tetratricopeptide (TPR) repeat protein